MTYLILRFSSIGNVAMTVPIMASLSKRYPEDKFIMVSKKRLSGMFVGYKNIIFHEADFKQGGLKSIIHLYKELKEYKPDIVIDLQNVLRTQILRSLFALHGIQIHKINYGRWEKHWIILRGKRGLKPIPTEFERYKQTLHTANLETDDHFEQIPINRPALNHVAERFGEKEGFWIGIAPFAKRQTNMPNTRMTKEVIQHYAQTPNTKVFLFGAGEIECEILRQWASVFPNVISVAGMLPLEEELELMRKLDAMICLDSANQHLASLVHLRAISIWCGTHPMLGFYGWKQNIDDCIQISLNCRPCTIHGSNYCRFMNYECKNIKPEIIWQKLSH